MSTVLFFLEGILGPLLGVFVFDATGRYRTAFLIAIAACLMSCPFLWIAAPRKVRRRIPAGGRRQVSAAKSIID